MVLSILLDRSQYVGKKRQRVRKAMMHLARQQELICPAKPGNRASEKSRSLTLWLWRH
jgi:hypothetical protein